MLFKDTCIFYLQLWSPFCLAEWNHLCNFGRGQYEEHLCEITCILNRDQWFRRKCCLKIHVFFIYSSGRHFVWQSGTICAILGFLSELYYAYYL